MEITQKYIVIDVHNSDCCVALDDVNETNIFAELHRASN